MFRMRENKKSMTIEIAHLKQTNKQKKQEKN